MGKRSRKKAGAKRGLRLGVAATPPTEESIRDELLAYWDADSPLTLDELKSAYAKGVKLGDVGILSQEAETYANKYNSIIYRMPGKGPLVSGNEAIGFLKKKMQDIVKEVLKRATP
jgi:hypothetical protein